MICSFLRENSFRLNIVPISPIKCFFFFSSHMSNWFSFIAVGKLRIQDFIFNCGGLSVAFVFVTNWDSDCMSSIFSRVQKLKGQFGNLYVIITLPTTEQNDSFVRNYFKYGMEIGRPIFVPVQDLEMGFEKIVKIAHARGVCKRQDVLSKLKVEGAISGEDGCISQSGHFHTWDNHDSFLFDIQSTMKLHHNSSMTHKVLSPEMSLATVRAYIWKKPDDLVLSYRVAWKMGVIMENGAAIGPSLSAEAKRTTCKLEWPPVSWRIHSSDNDDDSFVDENMWGLPNIHTLR
ncbi:hypothetical protein IFM89_036569, partial [Coptis chinensis]